jgi:hypothetical protein
MKKMFALPVYLVYALLTGCASSPPTSTSSKGYSEDLSALRPVFEVPAQETKAPTEDIKRNVTVEPTHTVNKPLHAVLDSIDRINLLRKSVDGFTIQVYSGQKREDALNAKRTIDQALPELKAEMVYIQPTFRIKAGKYFTQLDAQKDYVAVKRFFPNAILVPDKIAIN